MLETRNLWKMYTPKKGVPVVALNDVSLKFPERGMVFLLGKSGSGKSTLLNLLGGLDKYDSGEIIIKGVSSRDFSQTRFDSYRNTYVGFIFQEYNVLEEFSVGANIALALELQGKKATDEEINRILEEVDLVGYGNRKPNELSGGQLQRVAIARALVKSPEIIMADEPTGALDSATGKQVFDTLKKLSAEKLVIIVSHDREYAEFYADRIIELADGRVISDVEHVPEDDGDVIAISFAGDTVTIPKGYHLTEEDRCAINAYIDKLNSGARLSLSGMTKKFKDTDQSAIPAQDPSKFALIKSRLPLHSAFRIGSNGLTHKKFRLVMTILLSVVAFTLFALTYTFASYNHIEACTNSLDRADIPYLSMQKAKKVSLGPLGTYWSTGGFKISDEEIAEITEATGVPVKGVFVPRMADLTLRSYTNNYSEELEKDSYGVYTMFFSGFAEMTDTDLSSLGYSLAAGRMPDGSKNEIAIPQYVVETFIRGGFITGKFDQNTGEPIYEKISSASDMLGKKLTLTDEEYEIVGVVDTHLDLSRYESLIPSDEEQLPSSVTDDLIDYALALELEYARSYSFHSVIMVGKGKIASLVENESPEMELIGKFINLNYYDENGERGYDIWPDYVGHLSDIKGDVIWADGTPRTHLEDGEIVVSSNILSYFNWKDDEYFDDFRDYPDDIFSLSFDGYIYSYGTNEELSDWHIVGIVDHTDDEYNSIASESFYASDGIYEKMTDGASGVYSLAVGTMPDSRADIERIVRYGYDESGDVRYQIQNPVTYELDLIDELLDVLAGIFLWIGVGFAVFASVMLANFIATSIAYKKQEIGILRAIGSRSSDVFNIFFAEAFIIAMINFVISSVAAFAITTAINFSLKAGGLLIEVLSFGILQAGLVLLISVGVAAVSCFIPVWKIASKRPIDAIRGR